MSGLWAMVITAAAVFGLPKWRERLRDKAGQALNRKEAAYKRKFRREMEDINRWREENPPPKKLNVVCKNPAFAAAWE